jgi:hypothetical protein
MTIDHIVALSNGFDLIERNFIPGSVVELGGARAFVRGKFSGEEGTPSMKTDLSWAGRPKPLRRTAARSFSLATKQQRFQEVEGRCEACGELIGDGTDWRRAIYHHRRLVSDPTVSDKEAPANCMVLHPACHDDPVDFYRLHGFFPDNLRRK